VSGLAFSFDLTRAAGSRILNLAIQDSQGNDLDVLVRGGVLVGDPARTFRMVTLNFLASGGDSYPFPTDATANRVDLFSPTAPLTGAATFSGDGTEQDALAEFLKANHATLAKAYNQADTSASQDLRLQNTALRTDEVIDVKIGTAGADDSLTSESIKLQGFDGKNDLLFSGAGEDLVDVASLSGFANRIFTGSGVDTIYAGTRDVITGGSGDDWLSAEAGDGNRLSGGLGNDSFIIGSSANRALGGAGDDKFYVLGGAATNHLNGGTGADQFWLVSEIGDLPASKQFVMDFQLGADKVGLAGVAFSSLSFSQLGSDTLLKVAGVEVGHFTNLSATSLNNQANFTGLS
jgi:Ca2+-binding RTX toxin-like protein